MGSLSFGGTWLSLQDEGNFCPARSSVLMDSASTGPPSETLCRYFTSNICRYGPSCPFSHDQNAKPDQTCRYYLVGQFDHKRPATDERKSARSSVKSANCSSEGSNLMASKNSNLSAEHRAGAAAKDHVFSANAAEFIPSWKVVSSSGSNNVASGSTELLPLCPYFETGNCSKGDKCNFVHGDVCDLCNVPCLHPNDAEQRAQHRRECMDAHEAAMEEAFGEARSADKVCGVCMENIRKKNCRFGILEGCIHCFCLDCIRQWRRNQSEQFEKKTIRSCPECRTHSDFVVPATYWVEDKAEKEELIARYRQNAKKKLCKYVKGGRVDDCPFGNKCFYKHALPDGTIVEGESPRTLRRRRRLLPEYFRDSDSDYDEDELARLARHIMNRAFSIT